MFVILRSGATKNLRPLLEESALTCKSGLRPLTSVRGDMRTVRGDMGTVRVFLSCHSEERSDEESEALLEESALTCKRDLRPLTSFGVT